MKTLFIYTNINGFHEDCYSFGLASIVSMARINNYETRVVIVRAKDEYIRIIEEIDSFKPQVIGFSSVSSQFNFVKEIAMLIKKRFADVITVCGGVHPTINPNCLLETNFLDGIFIGESENSFVEFLRKVEKKESYKDTDNLAYLENGELIINRLKPLIDDLDTLPFPDRQIYPFENNLKRVGNAHFLFSRGCPFLCSYCSNHAIAKRYALPRNYPRFRSPESSICEIEETIRRFRVRKIFIGDDIFGLDKGWREDFCRKYRERVKIPFDCLLRADLVDEGLIKGLKDAGCYRVSIGVESGNEYIRNTIMNRSMSTQQITKAFEIAHKYRLQTVAINIIGVPGETEEMIQDTIKLNTLIKPTLTGVNIYYPYKGTKLGDYCFEKKMVDENLYYSFSCERRASVLNYSSNYKEKLIYYRENWEMLVYRFNIKRRIIIFLRRTFFWRHLRKLKRKIQASAQTKF